MGGKTTTIANSEQKLGTLRVQTSMYGLAIRLMWGQPRVTGNLVWFGNFRAVAHTTTEQSGGKGGGGVRQQNTTFAYYAAAMMALGRGPVAGIASAWKDKQRFGGVTVAGQVRTMSHTATVPVGGGTISVPLGGATFHGLVAATVPDYYTYSAGDTGP
jgi:hypothetical protein